MRLFLALGVLAACGGTTVPRESAKGTVAPRAAVRPALAPRDMVRALPAEMRMMFAVDARKLRKSPLVLRAWTAIAALPSVSDVFATMCGAESQIDYVLMAITDEGGKTFWGWMRGLDRHAKADCAVALEKAKTNPSKSVSHGDYVLETSTTSATEMLWFDSTTAFVYQHPLETANAGEAALRAAVDHGGGFSSDSDLGRLFDHLDFDAGAAMILDSSVAGTSGFQGMAVSLEADDGLRLQAYASLDTEDRATAMQSEYRTALSMLQTKQLIESSEARADGRGLAASLSVNGTQFDWWLRLALEKARDANAPPPPPPAATHDPS